MPRKVCCPRDSAISKKKREEIKFKDSTLVKGAIDNSAVNQEKFTAVSSKIEEKELPV